MRVRLSSEQNEDEEHEKDAEFEDDEVESDKEMQNLHCQTAYTLSTHP